MKNHHVWIIALAAIVATAVVLYARRLGDDDEITRQAVDALRLHPALAENDIQVSLQDGVATLTGQLPDKETKRTAIDEVRKIRGVREIVDQIEVVGATTSAPETTPDDAPEQVPDAADDGKP